MAIPLAPEYRELFLKDLVFIIKYTLLTGKSFETIGLYDYLFEKGLLFKICNFNVYRETK